MAEPLLTIRNLRVEIGGGREPVTAVDGVSIDVSAGEVTGVVGESGCGKSTLLRAIAGVPVAGTHVAEGEIVVRGHAVSAESRSRDVAMVFQDPMTGLDPVMRVGAQIGEVPLRRDGATRPQARTKALQLMEEVGIPEPERRFDQFPHELSGGLRQRVMIAAALSGDPALLLCDEPTTALDVTVRIQIVQLLLRLRRERGLAILYVSHDLPLVATLCDRVNVMYAGQIIERRGTPELHERPRHPYTRGLIEAAPRIGSRDRLTAIPGQPPRLSSLPDGCRFAVRCAHRLDVCQHATPLGPGVDDATACVRADDLDPQIVGGRT